MTEVIFNAQTVILEDLNGNESPENPDTVVCEIPQERNIVLYYKSHLCIYNRAQVLFSVEGFYHKQKRKLFYKMRRLLGRPGLKKNRLFEAIEVPRTYVNSRKRNNL